MRSLLNPTDRSEIEARLTALRPDATRQWGRMSVGGMLCHLSDAFEVCLGERDAGRTPRLHERTLMRFVALHTPVPWPKGVKTVAACDQEAGGTPPAEFERDKATLRAVLERFMEEIQPGKSVHPIFGPLSAEEWGHWSWRHVDHHLRQFSA